MQYDITKGDYQRDKHLLIMTIQIFQLYRTYKVDQTNDEISGIAL